MMVAIEMCHKQDADPAVFAAPDRQVLQVWSQTKV
jgi:hypothetical protein